uniref:NADH-ubiquinone oxidoreductase chain 5 n=1 Tax=Tuxedo bicinctus TaxID=2127002 RepID=A0A514LQ60_9HEMI|nr:NADH dehydrogenase subunit 5 [Tuxedo bicinctus]QDI93953.1 NADH dehydrogenase subunit 5 [Tuxedo bicinctus]
MFIFYYVVSFFLFSFGILFFLFGLYFMGIDLSMFFDWEILSLNSCSICLTLIFDYMSMTFMGCVLLISSMVIFYSDSYMDKDKHKLRFLILVFLFIISMMMMILSPNLISILLGWDGLGLVSYCLVIYFQNIKSYNAGMLTIIINRIGDVSILVCISWMLNFGGWNFIYLFYFLDDFMYIIYLLIVLSAFTSSAQIPFSSWLPAAMAAPTPVSALVHSSTLVTAGVYLLIRFYPLLKFYECGVFIMISIMTMFMSGLGANFEFDLKSIIALSTLSQLGLMMGILFIGFPNLSFFHLLTHAFFKALLFLCAGLIIHVMNDSQDIRDMGFVGKSLPFTSSCFIISSFSLAGMPFLSGFYSKDMIIEFLFMNEYNLMYYIVFLVSVVFTMSYSVRLFNYLMVSGSGNYCYQAYLEDKVMILSMIFLTIFSVSFGVCLTWVMFKTPFFYVSSFYIKMMPLFSVFLGLVLGCLFSNYFMDMHNMFMVKFLYFVGSMWYMPIFSTHMMYSSSLNLSINYFKLMDMGWGEFFMSKSHISFALFLSKVNIILEYNNYKLFMLSFLFLLFFFMI